MAEAGGESARKESRAMSLRERTERGEGETVRFGGSVERAVIVDRSTAEKEEVVETTVGNGIANACFCSLVTFARFFKVESFLLSYSTQFPYRNIREN